MSASRVRRLATHPLTVELEIPNVRLAAALGYSRQDMKQGRDRVEDLRDHSAVDALLDRCAAQIQTWRTAPDADTECR
jgi:hypothetical protein